MNTTYTGSRPVIVGVDGTEESKAAVRWGVSDARARKAPLELLYAHDSAALRLSETDLAGWDQKAESLVADWAAETARSVQETGGPDAVTITVTGRSEVGNPVRVLTAQSERAAVMVVGARRLGRFGALIGSVGSGLAAQARCPVVVVHDEGAEPNTGAPVVVGIGSPSHAERVLGFALEHAARHDRPVHVILGLRRARGWGERGTERRARASSLLGEAMAGWADKYPTVRLESRVGERHPVEELAEASKQAALVVVGARGRRAGIGALLGSVSQGVLHSAECPVAVVHA